MNLTLVETLDDYNWRVGNSFSFFFAKRDVASIEQINLAMVVGENNVAIDLVEITGNPSIISWEWYAGSEVEDSTGDSVFELPLNATVQSTSGAKLLINPTIIELGTSVIPQHVDSYGMLASYSRVRLSEILVKRKLALLKNTTNILRITSHDGGLTNIEVLIDLFKMKNIHINKSKQG